MSKITYCSPVFAVADPIAAATYYANKHGFVIEGNPVKEYAIVSRDAHEIHFIDRHSSDPLSEYGDRGGAYMLVSDPDALYEELVKRGAAIKYPPTDQFYGLRDFAVIDPYGYCLCFGKRLKDVCG